MIMNKQVRKRGNGWGSSKGATWRASDLLVISLALLLTSSLFGQDMIRVGTSITLGTGTTAAQLQTVLDSLSSTGGVVRLSAERIGGNFTIPSNVRIEGAGSNTVISSATGASPVLTISGTGDIIEDLDVDGAGSGTSDIGILVTGNGNVIRNVGCNWFGEECLRWASGQKLQVQNLFAMNTAMAHVMDTTGKHCAVLFGGVDGTISDSEVGTSIQSWGFNPSLIRDALCVTGSNNFVYGNQFETSDDGLYVSGYYNKFWGNRADTNGANGFWDVGVGNLFTGNHSLNNSLASDGTYSGFLLDGNGAVVSGNLDSYEGGICLKSSGPCREHYSFYTPNPSKSVPGTLTGNANHASKGAIPLLGGLAQ